LPATDTSVPNGSTPANCRLISGIFNAGAATSATVTFQVTGSGPSRVGISLDDLFFQSVPELGTWALMAGGLCVMLWAGRRW
jgi:hypothetical protein